MHIIINNLSMVPIYEQIMEQIKSAILCGELTEGAVLPSVRTLSRELKISALTVKKAYDNLEQEGFTITVHGKGTYVAATNQEFMKEENLKEVLYMGKFAKGLLMGAAIGAALEMMMMPQMDRRTQRSMRRAARRMRAVADSAYDGIHDWMS